MKQVIHKLINNLCINNKNEKNINSSQLIISKGIKVFKKLSTKRLKI